MTVETITELFSYICGQSRSFFVDSTPLPVDQRCLGLYVGASLTASWLLASGIWRQGLPTPGVVAVNVALLIAALLGGLHVIDPGPLWRLNFGLWTGHVAMLWLSGAAADLWFQRDRVAPGIRRWGTAATLQGMLAPFALTGLAANFPAPLALGWTFWTAFAVTGVLALAAGLGFAVLAMARAALRSRRIV